MYSIIWSPKAKIALYEALRFIVEKQKIFSLEERVNYAKKVQNEIEYTEQLLMKNPYIAVSSGYPNILKCVILEKYSMFLRVNENKKVCDVVYFWDNRQNPKKLENIL